MAAEDTQVVVANQQAPSTGFAPTPENIELLKKTLGDVTLKDNELELFLYQAKRTGLDPLARQIYVMKHGDRATFMVSIDGQRLVAQRTGEYEGQVGPQWCGMDGKWSDVWLKNDPPAAARVGVYRRGFKEPVYGVATGKSYNTGKSVWRDKPDVMLAKCAEALALRKAFPQELAGLYTDEEMPPADQPHARMSLPEAMKQAADILTKGGVTSREDKLAIIFGIAEIENVQQMTGAKMQHVLTTLKRETVADLITMYVPDQDDIIEGETVNQVSDEDLEQVDRDITELYAEQQQDDPAEDTPTVIYNVPKFPATSSPMIPPGMVKQIKDWIQELGYTDVEVVTFMHGVIGKEKPKNRDEAQTVLEYLADELNERAALAQKEAA